MFWDGNETMSVMNQIQFGKQARKEKKNWPLRVGPIEFQDSDGGGDNDPERDKHRWSSFVRSQFKRIYLPIMDEFQENWFQQPQANALSVDDKTRDLFLRYLFIIYSTRNMLRRLEEIDQTYPVCYESQNWKNRQNITSSLFYYRKEIFEFTEKTDPALSKFLIEFHELDQVGRMRVGMVEFMRIENGILSLLRDLFKAVT